jgi:hypothetical protein
MPVRSTTISTVIPTNELASMTCVLIRELKQRNIATVFGSQRLLSNTVLQKHQSHVAVICQNDLDAKSIVGRPLSGNLDARNGSTGAGQLFLRPTVKIERQVLRKFWTRNAAIPVLGICDLPAPKQPLTTRDRPAALRRQFRQSGHPPRPGAVFGTAPPKQTNARLMARC